MCRSPTYHFLLSFSWCNSCASSNALTLFKLLWLRYLNIGIRKEKVRWVTNIENSLLKQFSLPHYQWHKMNPKMHSVARGKEAKRSNEDSEWMHQSGNKLELETVSELLEGPVSLSGWEWRRAAPSQAKPFCTKEVNWDIRFSCSPPYRVIIRIISHGWLISINLETIPHPFFNIVILSHLLRSRTNDISHSIRQLMLIYDLQSYNVSNKWLTLFSALRRVISTREIVSLRVNIYI